MAGAMGGSASEEFLAPCPSGEDVRCSACDYAANVEAVNTPAPPAWATGDLPPARVADTPGTETIARWWSWPPSATTICNPDRDWVAADTLKNVVVMLTWPDGRSSRWWWGCPATARSTPSASRPLSPRPCALRGSDFAAHPALVRGYIGPGSLGSSPPGGIRYLVDPRVVDGTAWITGADEPDRHVFGLVAGRDFVADGTIEAAEVRAGDPCPRCGSALEIARGIEIGHIFQLGPQNTLKRRPAGAGRERRTGHGDHGQLRHRGVAGGGRDRRADP